METPRTLPTKDLKPWPGGLNSRKRFDEDSMEELRTSIEDIGIVQPLGVTLQEKPPHWIFAGERRWRASKGILTELPVHIRNLTEAQAIHMNLTENIQRNALTPMEEAHGLNKYMEKTGKTQTEVAEEFGKTQGWVSGRIRLLRLPKALEDLFDAEAFTQSQARDLILPFASLPDKQWEAFCKALHKALKRKFTKEKFRGLTEEEIREPASKVAMAMSGWLDRHFWNEDKTETFESHTHIPKKRWKDAPSGTVITYLFGQYPHDRSTRAFDMDWWQEQMHIAQVEEEEERQRRKREIEEGDGAIEEGGQDLEWAPSLGPIPIGTFVPHEKRHVVYTPITPNPGEYDYSNRDALAGGDGSVRRVGNLNADPTVIPKDNLVIQDGSGKNQWNQPVVLCTDYAVYEAAVESLITKRDTLVNRRVARQGKADIEASKGIKLAQAIPSLLALGTAFEQTDFLTDAAEDLGIENTWSAYSVAREHPNHHDHFEWVVQMQTYLAGLKKTELDAIAKLLVYRITRSSSGAELDMRGNVRQSAAFELRVKLLKDLGDTLDLPEWKGTQDAEEQ